MYVLYFLFRLAIIGSIIQYIHTHSILGLSEGCHKKLIMKRPLKVAAIQWVETELLCISRIIIIYCTHSTYIVPIQSR